MTAPKPAILIESPAIVVKKGCPSTWRCYEAVVLDPGNLEPWGGETTLRTVTGRPHPISSDAAPAALGRYAHLGRHVTRYLLTCRTFRAYPYREDDFERMSVVEADTRFLDVYTRFHSHVYAYCRRRTSAEMVEDAVSDTFLTAWRKSSAIPPGDEALPWLYGVAYRVMSHQWRSASRQSRLARRLASLGSTSISLPEEVIVMRHESRQLLIALAALKRIDQEILRLTAWEELSGAEVAAVLGISPGAVRQRTYAAKKKLADEYNRLERKRPGSPAAEKGGVR
jgi:RNA polymerase sigma-70 factor (ECF subfamily)